MEPYTLAGGNPARPIRRRFDEELISLLLALRWWDFAPEKLVSFLPILCSDDLETVRKTVKDMLASV